MFAKLAAFFLMILYTVSSFLSFIPQKVWFGSKKYETASPEDLLFSAALLADTHSDSGFFHDRSKTLRKTVCGVSQAERLPDALVIAGDISNASDKEEYDMFKWCLKTFNKIPSVIPATGNHDTRASDTYEEAQTYFSDFAAAFGIGTEKTYYAAEVNGYPFIVLGSEGQLRLEAVLSDEQLAWFENELQKATAGDKPVFIVCHQPMYDSNNVFFDASAEKNHGIGAESDKVEAIIRKYVPSCKAPVFFISGHLHWGYGVELMDTTFCENLFSVNLPSVSKNEETGLGMVLEVYKDKILLRGINFITQEWKEDWQYEIPVK